ncbi:MAG: isocitrate/isopropylmalate dehydrogenase family protein [Synergistales bacterium]|nr:isocitrate/isopropylmalate dehydrogenase family protein [Synergistales bacterium]
MARNEMTVKEKKDRYQVAYIPGDDTGFDVMEANMVVMEALGAPIDWVRTDAGWCMWEQEGDTVPEKTWETLRNTDAALMAAITSKPGVKGFKSAILQMRQKFELYVNLRPAKAMPGVPSMRDDIDIVTFRENTEGLYSAVEWRPVPDELYDLHPNMARFKGKEDVAASVRVFTREGCERIIRAAFKYAHENGLKKMTVVEKPNVIRLTSGMFVEIAQEVAKEYPGIEMNKENVDATAMWMLKNPQNYECIVTSNMFGDIISDEASQLVGGMGVTASGNIGADYALFEPCHGSAPKYAGQYKVNPIAMLNASKMLLDYLELDDYSKKLENAMFDVLREGKVLTYDILREQGDPKWETDAASTLDMAKEIARKLNPDFDKKADEICKKAKEMNKKP